SQRRPELRRGFLRWAPPRLYEHGGSAAMVAVGGGGGGGGGVFFRRHEAAENPPPTEKGGAPRPPQTPPSGRLRAHPPPLRAARLPRPLRRLAWRWAHGLSGPRRVKYFGTFGVSVTAAEGAAALTLVSPTTTTLHYGVMAPNGDVDVRLTFDHRVIDGAP